MDQRRSDYLGKAQHKNEMLVVSEFDFPFRRFDILPREGAVILRLQGFGVVSIIGLNLNFVRIGDLAIQFAHTRMYTRIQVWLKTGNGAWSWTTITRHHDRHYFSTILIQAFNY
jgi:hypothetical protein